MCALKINPIEGEWGWTQPYGEMSSYAASRPTFITLTLGTDKIPFD